MGLMTRLRAAANAFMGATVPDEVSRVGEESPGRGKDEGETIGLALEVDSSKELTPEKIRDYFMGVGHQLEDYHETVKRGLRKVQVVLERLNREIGELQVQGSDKAETVSRMQSERDRLRGAALKLESRIEEYRERLEAVTDEAPGWSFLNDTEVYDDVNGLWRDLRDILHRTEADDGLLYDTSGIEIYFRDVFPVWKGTLPLWKRPGTGDTESPAEEGTKEASAYSGTKRRTKTSGADPYQQLTQELIDALRMTTRPVDNKPEDEED